MNLLLLSLLEITSGRGLQNETLWAAVTIHGIFNFLTGLALRSFFRVQTDTDLDVLFL